MKILGIETSCDDTGIAIIEVKEDKTPNFNVLANKIASQIKVHQKYGGVFPMMAKREHQKNIVPTFIEALKEAKLLKISNFQFPISNKFSNEKISQLKIILEREPELGKKLTPFLKKYQKPSIDYIAVTNGPGLEPCLWVGVNFARALSYFWEIPLIPVNHIEGHILVNFVDSNSKFKIEQVPLRVQKSKITFPAISLIVSGGHTQLILMNKIGDYKILGETRDDAAGECFDKAAKILGLGYPGGPIISKLASQVVIPGLTRNPELSASFLDSRFCGNDIRFPRPMINTKDYDFSFSGLKTAILYAYKKQEQAWSNLDDRPKLTTMKKQYKIKMAAEIQQAIIDVLLKKTFKTVKDFNVRTIILGGGVSANSELRRQFKVACNRHCEGKARSNLNLMFPPTNLSTDNGLMIAVAGYFNLKKGGEWVSADWANLKADSNLRIGE